MSDLEAARFEPRCPQCSAPLTVATVTEDAPLDPRNAYAASKLAQEHLAATWARMTGGSAVALRYHNVYGPRMPRDTPYSGVAAIFRSALEAGRSPQVYEDGQQRRDFVHVHDVARANLAALRGGRAGLAAGLQHRQRGAAHGRRDGGGAGRRVRRSRSHGDRPLPAGRRPAHRGVARGGRPGARVPGRDPVRRRDGRVRPRAAAPPRDRRAAQPGSPASPGVRSPAC